MLATAFSMTGRRALITGSADGIGKAIALGFAEAGAELIVLHGLEPEEELQPLLAEIQAAGARALYIRQDLLVEGAGRALAEQAIVKAAHIDILVLNAAIQVRKSWEEITSEEAERQLRVNLLAPLEIAQTLVPPMRERGWGRVLAIGSVQQAKPLPQMAVYAASKAAQMNWVMNLAKRLAPGGITVNTLSPGTILTQRTREVIEREPEKVASSIPMGSVGYPADCVGAALLLCSEAGRYITGIDLPVDGGARL